MAGPFVKVLDGQALPLEIYVTPGEGQTAEQLIATEIAADQARLPDVAVEMIPMETYLDRIRKG